MKKEIRKAITGLLALLLIVSMMAGCDNGNTPTSEPPSTPSAETTIPATTPAPTPAPTPETDTDPGIDLSGRSVVDAGLFSVAYTEEWEFDEDNARIGDNSANIKFLITDDEDTELYALTIEASKDAAKRHRTPFTSNGIDLRDLADGKLDSVIIDNTTFYHTGDRNEVYRYRHDPSGVNYCIKLVTKEEAGFSASPVVDIVQGIKLNLTDDGEIATPWPWDGARWVPKLSAEMAGSFTLTPVFLQADDPIISTVFLDSSFTVVGNMIYVVAGNYLSAYRMSGDSITFEKTLELDKEYNKIRSDKNGKLYLSPKMGNVDVYDDFTLVMATTAKATLIMHPSGEWGINYWVGTDTEKITLRDGVLTSEPWVIKDMNKDGNTSIFNSMYNISITDSYIIATGFLTDPDDSGMKIVAYDYNGKEKLTLENTKDGKSGLGAITGTTVTPNGFFALDGNMREIALWTPNGTHIGKVDTNKLFGASYCWLEDMYQMDDGSIIVMISQERDDKSAEELLFFRLTGF